jgi:DNA-binding protein YbaB
MGGMFNQLKDIYKLQKEAREMQKKMKEVKITGISDDEDVKIFMNGLQEIDTMEISDDLMGVDNKKQLIKEIKEAMKDAQKKLQKELSKDMDISQLKNMLGAS